jgi:hypothetical protein
MNKIEKLNLVYLQIKKLKTGNTVIINDHILGQVFYIFSDNSGLLLRRFYPKKTSDKYMVVTFAHFKVRIYNK